MKIPIPLFSRRLYWAARFGTAPFLPLSRTEMDTLGWDSCDIILVTGDAYVDHPSFGMAIIGRLLEAQGFRIGIIAQPDWNSAEPFQVLGRPNLFFGVTAGNMDSVSYTHLRFGLKRLVIRVFVLPYSMAQSTHYILVW